MKRRILLAILLSPLRIPLLLAYGLGHYAVCPNGRGMGSYCYRHSPPRWFDLWPD